MASGSRDRGRHTQAKIYLENIWEALILNDKKIFFTE